MSIDLASLGPFARRQIVEQLIGQKNKTQSGKAITAADFDNDAEKAFYKNTIVPMLCGDSLERCELHKEYELYTESNYCGLKLQRLVFSPAFVLLYSNGTVEVIEIKSKPAKKQPQDYPLRRRLFIEMYCRPRGWLWREIISENT